MSSTRSTIIGLLVFRLILDEYYTYSHFLQLFYPPSFCFYAQFSIELRVFVKLEEIRQEVQADKSVLRFSMDAKATVLIGDYSRGGPSRIQVHAADHDFKSDEKVTPYCIFLPDHNQAYLYLLLLSHYIADRIAPKTQYVVIFVSYNNRRDTHLDGYVTIIAQYVVLIRYKLLLGLLTKSGIRHQATEVSTRGTECETGQRNELTRGLR